jgi:hypothetical protein
MRSYTRLLVLMLIFPLALSAKANEGKIEGILHGYVTDAVTKKPLQGVTVLAILPGTNASKQAMTDADGYFHFVQLPAAQVTVVFDKKGYQSSKRAGVTINNRTAVNLNMECLPEELGADANAEYPILRILQAS